MCLFFLSRFHWTQSHPLYIGIQQILYDFYKQKRRFQDSLRLQQASLICCHRALGHNHYQTALIYYDLCGTYYQMGQKIDAIQYLEMSLEIMKIEKGPDSIHTAVHSKELAKIYNKRGEKLKSLRLYERVLEILKQRE